MSEQTLRERSGLIQVGEMLHASIPSPGQAMRALHDGGAGGFDTPGQDRDFLRDLIVSQARSGADYIDINVDALGERPEDAMRSCVRLVREYGEGVAPSIDSSNPAVLLAGLEAWFATGGAPPLVNSIPYHEADRYGEVLALRRERAFGVVCLLMGNEGALGSAEEIVSAARGMFERVRGAGFASDEVFFDTVTLGIASDGCMSALGEMKCSHTHNAFEAIRRIRGDGGMRGVHAILGVSNWAYGARKRRVGHIRAFIEVAKRYGLDAAIVDVDKEYGAQPAPPELVGFVEGFASLDGSEDSMLAYQAMMRQARESEWI